MRLSNMMWVLVAACAALLLYSVKYRVQAMDEEIAVLQARIAEERAAIHVLHAEWAYLTRPERVRKLAQAHLDMEPARGQQMLELADLPFSPDSPVRLAAGEGVAPQLRPGVIPVGGAGYAR